MAEERKQDESGQDKAPAPDERRLLARRALVQAGWTVPVIAGVTMLAKPASAGWVTIHGDGNFYTDYNRGGSGLHTDFTKWEYWDY